MMAPPNSPSPPAPVPQSERTRKLIGTTIGGRYKVLRLLGEGGMGSVLLVEHAVIRKRMALKVLNDEKVTSPEAVARFEREALAAAQIDHPNVVSAIDSGKTEDGTLFVVFEYVDGQPLYDRIAEGPLPAPLALHIARQVTSALVRAHAIGIVHRDLKAENIMLESRDGDVVAKVLDFGLAKLSEDLLLQGSGGAKRGDVLTRFGTAIGTPAYMAPEQATGSEVDGRTDLYALGILLYEMLTSELPFESDDPAKMLRMHLTSPVPPMKSRVPGLKVPQALEAMVFRLLEKQPENRYESAKALLEAIDVLVRTEKLQYGSAAQSSSVNPASENATVVAPAGMAAQLLGPPPPDAQNASLAVALKDLKERLADDKAAGQDPSLNGLAAQFGTKAATVTPPAGVPPMLAEASGKPDEPPKLKAPSSIDLEAAQPEGAAKAVLTPAPPPTLAERAREAIGEAVGSPGEASSQQEKAKTGPSPLAILRTKISERCAKLLDRVRARLPEQHRGISQRTLGLSVGAMLLLPILILILIVATSGDDSASSGSAAMPGFATEREMEKAVRGDLRDLMKLAAKYPNDSRVVRALARAHLTRKDYASAMRAFSMLQRLDPSMAGDDEMVQILVGAALIPETSDAAIAMLESQLGDKGVSLLSDLAERTTIDPWKSKLNASLQKGTTRALASEATVVLLDLRAAPRCEDKRTLLKRAGQQGDARTLSYLQAVQQTTTGCGANGQADCWACLRKGTALKATMDAITKRLGG